MRRSPICCWLLVAGLAGGGCQRRAPTAERPPTAQDGYRQPQRLVAALGLRPGQQVAELGAGGGYLTLRLAEAVGIAGRVVATDVDDAALRGLAERAQRRAQPAAPIATRLVRADESGLEPGGYDLILLAQVDQLLPERRRYLERLQPALRPGGRIAVSNREGDYEGLHRDAVAAGYTVERLAVALPAQFLLLLRPTAMGKRGETSSSAMGDGGANREPAP